MTLDEANHAVRLLVPDQSLLDLDLVENQTSRSVVRLEQVQVPQKKSAPSAYTSRTDNSRDVNTTSHADDHLGLTSPLTHWRSAMFAACQPAVVGFLLRRRCKVRSDGRIIAPRSSP